MFYNNQKIAGDKCLDLLINRNSRIIRLCAEMQSGKTGTYGYIGHLITQVKEYKNTFTKLVVFCQESNIALKNQIEKDLSFLPKDFVEVYHRATANEIKSKSNTLSRTLFIFDESHIAQKQSNVPYNLLRQCVLNDLTNGLILVSATNFIADMNKNIPKVVLEPGHDYYGIKEMFKMNKIFQSNKLLQSNRKLDSLFINAIQRMRDNTYAIARVHTSVLSEKCKKILTKQFKDLDILVVNSKTNTELMNLEFLNNKPSRKTVVLINNLARCGKQVNTEHCSFMWDTSSSNTDTCSQSLLGRSCGYNKKHHGVEIYTDLVEARNFLDYVENGYDVDKMKSFKESGMSKTTKTVSGEVPKLIKYPKLKEKLAKHKTAKAAVAEILKELKIDHVLDTNTVRDFSNSEGKAADRRLDILEAIAINQGYWFGETKNTTGSAAICSNNGEIFLLKKRSVVENISNYTKNSLYIADAIQ